MQTCFETYVCLQMAQLGIHPWCSSFPPVVSRCERQCSRSRRAAWEIQVGWVRWGRRFQYKRYEDVMEICRHGMFFGYILLKLIHGFLLLPNAFPSGKNPVQLCWGPYSLCPYWVPAGRRGFQCLQVHKLTTVHDPKNLEAIYRLMGGCRVGESILNTKHHWHHCLVIFQLWPDDRHDTIQNLGLGCFG